MANKSNGLLKLRLGLVCLHTMLLAFCLFKASTDYYLGVMSWLLLALVDFPVSLLLQLEVFYYAGDKTVNEVIIPGVFFLIAGSLWWFYLPAWVYGLVRRLRGQGQAPLGSP